MSDSDREIENVWAKWDLPTLRAIARWEQGLLFERDPWRFFDEAPQLTAFIGGEGGEQWKVGRALRRLQEEGFIRADSEGPNRLGFPEEVWGLTTKGLREVGAWPTTPDRSRAVLDRLRLAAERLDKSDAELAQRFRVVAQGLESLGKDRLEEILRDAAVGLMVHQ
jgi:DNA-binding PadR family transcriptional regulator